MLKLLTIREPFEPSGMPTLDTFCRSAFSKYLKQAIASSYHRAQKASVPFAIDYYDLDRLMVDQKWRCAISNITFVAPGSTKRNPFGPSLDRIHPKAGYVTSNIRFVCNIVNTAMNEWGSEALMTLVDTLKR